MVSAIEKQVLQSQVLDRIQQVQQQHPDMQQQYFNIQLSQERRKLKKKVNESEQIYHARISEDDWERQQKDEPREQEAPEQEVDGKASAEQKQPDHIDIKV
ncbi:MAG: hypothetical protein L7F78_13935 [Syntrophales bacterium LBB04]|nr:hypothetical protein [Syntrophales bacterium LBB04]